MAKLSIIFFVAVVFVLGFSYREVVAHSGTATFYTAPYVPSACYGYEDDGVMIAAASDAIWDGGAVCGRQYKVKCKGATNESPHPCRGQDYVVVKIVDYCPSGCQDTIDLSQEAFAAIADPDAGKIKIYFHHDQVTELPAAGHQVGIWQGTLAVRESKDQILYLYTNFEGSKKS
ncbi:hypothetical protein V6N12_025072 [Hibiscus sabdariffa]|uniref:Expansin-like EG45 domain-containing protein n=1 Tax=Hibiscus sabdariffa TaxID=183260 RepID=A0ABR2BLF6_9ROSI